VYSNIIKSTYSFSFFIFTPAPTNDHMARIRITSNTAITFIIFTISDPERCRQPWSATLHNSTDKHSFTDNCR